MNLFLYTTIFVFAAGCAAVEAPALPDPVTSQPPTATTAAGSLTVLVGDVAFEAEPASTTLERAKGLSDRDALPSKTGMLFIFDAVGTHTFWMKGMRFPLDFIWVSQECAVVEITADVPVPDPTLEDLPRYTPASPVAYNLEINAGEAERNGVGVGDRVRFLNVPDDVAAACE